jgi:hypothetical protein
MSLYISVNTASSGLSDSAINNAVTRLAVKVAGEKQQGNIPAGPSLDVTFMLPGQVEKPDFTGMRMGGYTPEDDTLYFETAVPEHILHSQHAGQYVAMVMEDVIANAEAFFADSTVAFDARQWQQCVARLAEAGATAPATLH